jgi:hypothetical protein
MASAAEQQPAHPLWVEAAGVVQADHDVDVRLEARGLVVAEMADVTFAERLAAVQPGSQVTVLIRSGERLTAMVVHSGEDFLVLRAAQFFLIPANAIVGISSLPRVLHDEPTTTTQRARTVTWRSILRELLGESMQIEANGVRHLGRLTWVGADHVSLTSEGPGCVEVTIRWARIDAVALPTTWDLATELR